jgi:hypothetical protein
MNRELYRWADEIENREMAPDIRNAFASASSEIPWSGHSLHPVMGELVGARLMRTLGIGTSNVEFVPAEEARQRNPREWVVKTITGGRLKIQPRGGRPQQSWAVVSEKIPGAISLFYLRRFYGVFTNFGPVPFLSTFLPGNQFDRWEKMRLRVWIGKNQLPSALDFYEDFTAPADWGPILKAIAWNSEPMLAMHAARAFLGTTFSHASNTLVDAEGRLSTIDMEFAVATTGDDLEKLFGHIVPETRAFEALRPVAELSEYEVAELFDELPEVGWPLGSKEKTAEYYTERLRKWKGLFETRSKN